MKKKPGAPLRNQNASKYSRQTKRYSLTCEVRDFDKWQKLAEKSGVSLNQWILNRLIEED